MKELSCSIFYFFLFLSIVSKCKLSIFYSSSRSGLFLLLYILPSWPFFLFKKEVTKWRNHNKHIIAIEHAFLLSFFFHSLTLSLSLSFFPDSVRLVYLFHSLLPVYQYYHNYYDWPSNLKTDSEEWKKICPIVFQGPVSFQTTNSSS